MANVGGMQRVALKLHESLDAKAAHSETLAYDSYLLRSPWRTLHVKVPFFLAGAARAMRQAAPARKKGTLTCRVRQGLRNR